MIFENTSGEMFSGSLGTLKVTIMIAWYGYDLDGNGLSIDMSGLKNMSGAYAAGRSRCTS
jgi:hypothetical protein